jgi:hypothetical protein
LTTCEVVEACLHLWIGAARVVAPTLNPLSRHDILANLRAVTLKLRRPGPRSVVNCSQEIQVLYFEEAQDIWKNFVPPSGQAATVQGELLRAIEKLRDEAMRNGNGNWDRGFDLLLWYLRERLLDPKVFAPAAIEKTSQTLDRLADFEQPYLNDDLYDELGDRVVEYYKQFGSQPHRHNPELWR